MKRKVEIEKVLKGCIGVDKNKTAYFYLTSKKNIITDAEVYGTAGEDITCIPLGKVKKELMCFEDGIQSAILTLGLDTSVDIPKIKCEPKNFKKRAIKVPETKPDKKKKGRPAAKKEVIATPEKKRRGRPAKDTEVKTTVKTRARRRAVETVKEDAPKRYKKRG